MISHSALSSAKRGDVIRIIEKETEKKNIYISIKYLIFSMNISEPDGHMP